MRCGSPPLWSFSTYSPLSVVTTEYPSSSNISCRNSKMSGSSSTTSIFFFLLCIDMLLPPSCRLFRLFAFQKRQSKMKDCPLVFLTLDPHAASMSFDNLTGEIEANAKARIGFFFWIGHLIEPLKNSLLMFFRNADPKILDAHLGIFWVFDNTNNDRICLWGILDSVGHKINEHLPNAISITKYHCFCCTLKMKLMGMCGGLKIVHRFFHKDIEIKRFFAVGHFACLYIGNIQQITDEVR